MAARDEAKEARRQSRVQAEANAALAKALVSKPRCIEIAVQHSGGGKVAIKEYGKISSNWGLSMSRRFEIPEDWTQDQIDDFQLREHARLMQLIEPIDQAAFDERYEQRDWE